MTDETIQAVRDCAAIARVVEIQAMMSRLSARDTAKRIAESIERKWPDAFTETERTHE